MSLQYPFDKGVPRLPIAPFKRDLLIAADKLFHFIQRELFQVLHADVHSPAASNTSGPVFQAHLALESNTHFRLISHWKRTPVSGSFRIGQLSGGQDAGSVHYGVLRAPHWLLRDRVPGHEFACRRRHRSHLGEKWSFIVAVDSDVV